MTTFRYVDGSEIPQREPDLGDVVEWDFDALDLGLGVNRGTVISRWWTPAKLFKPPALMLKVLTTTKRDVTVRADQCTIMNEAPRMVGF